MKNESDVFISYATDTRPLAEELTQALQDHGFQAWADFKDLQPGQLWHDEIDRALDRAGWFLILVSPTSYATSWQEAEWRAALTKVWSDSEKRLIPVLVGGTEPPPFLRSWVSLKVDPAAEPATWTSRVLQALRSARNEAVHGLSDKDLGRRQLRLDEISRAAQELGKQESSPSESPPDSKS